MEENPKDKKPTKDQEFIVETPIYIEEKIGKTDKIRKYERGKFLGKGGFAKCYEMKSIDTGKIFAAKVFEKRALTNVRSRKKLINEIKLHKKLHHQNIVNFEHFFEDKENVYILLELCSNQTLNEILKRRKRLTEIEVQCYLIQIVKALKYIHSHKIIHRDLKLGNCFITQKLELKLGDFGLAAKLEYEGQRRRTVCGTPNYIAPEILEKKNGHSFEVDIWSLGVVAYTLLFGKPPFETADVKLTYKKIKMNNFTFPENVKVHPTAKKLIVSILNLDPSKRPSLDAILENEFFRVYNSVPVLLPLSTLACPPSAKYISQFTKNEGNFFLAHQKMNIHNTFSNLDLRKNPGKDNDGNGNYNDLNNDMDNVKIISSNPGDNQLHRKSESCNNLLNSAKGEDNNNQDNYMVKENKQAIGNNTRNINKNDVGFLNSDKDNPKADNDNDNRNESPDAEQFNDLEVDEALLKKLDDGQIIGMGSNLNAVSGFNVNLINANSLPAKNIFSFKISKFIDYSTKFGIVYFVNSTHIGICFNDFSNVLKNIAKNDFDLGVGSYNGNNPNMNIATNILNNKNFKFIYLEKDAKFTQNFDENGLEIFLQSTKTSNKELIKKFEIFKHIIAKHASEVPSMPTKDKNNLLSNFKIFYVKKFLKVQNAMLLRLSNKLVQVIFTDKTEIILSTETSDFVYKSKNGEESQDSIQNAMNSENTEVIKRIKYSKNMLIHFVKNHKSKKVPK